ncbi:EmrB/QacA subfamily drug resistance transporter [Actinocorallia herbida]|uniref:EmrB/QacA subfamily drug resistance transporter n=1 Tax=Actinocorallia herbida TaxID=58109 RepID=A0A3N1CP70_9ACTN|nr:MFS transporter [Actinocorallia herbida]ROO83073.1 EmrB/QacA subfamily drug resistance transporter [Actinocorallia herbida]
MSSPLDKRRRMLILIACCMSLLIVSLDNTVLNVALPSIKTDFDASVTGLQWALDAYTLVLAVFLMPAGALADRFGRRRVFRIGLGIFTAASLLCSLAPGLGWLIGARVLQAVGGSMLNPVAMAIITNTFTDPRERGRAIGVWGGVVGISMAAGPLVGGGLVAVSGWRSIFWLNVPIGLLAIYLATRHIPESKAARARRFDPVGQLLVAGLLGATAYGIIEGPLHGLGSPVVIGSATTAVLCLGALLWYEPRRTDPFIDLRFFRSPPFTGAALIAICACAALGGFLFVNTLYLQDVQGYSALEAGLFMLPMALMTLVCAPISGRLVGGHGPRLPLLLAGVCLTGSGLLLALTARGELPVWALLGGFLLFGIGFGMVNSPITDAAVSGMPREQAGVAGALASTSRQVGTAVGVAVIGSVVAHAQLSSTGFATAQRVTYWIIAACGAVVFLLGAATTGPRARAAATRNAAHLGLPTESREPALTAKP